MTASSRLGWLLPMANGDPLVPEAMRARLLHFLNGFETRGLRVTKDAGMWDAYRDAPDRELQAVQNKVQLVFATGFMFDEPRGAGTENIGPDDIRPPLTFPSLRFAAFSSTKKGRTHAGQGFTLMVNGERLRDLVAFLAMWLLTTGEVAVSLCSAPQRDHWDQRCNRFLLWSGRGRPPKVCKTGGCAARVKAKRKHEKAQRERKELEMLRKAAQRRRGRKKQ